MMPLLADYIVSPDESRSLSPCTNSSPTKKRKRGIERDEGKTKSKRAIKKRRSEKAKASMDEDGTLDLEQGINTAVGKMDSRLLADWVAQRAKRFAPDLGVVELEEQYLPGMMAIMSSGFV